MTCVAASSPSRILSGFALYVFLLSASSSHGLYGDEVASQGRGTCIRFDTLISEGNRTDLVSIGPQAMLDSAIPFGVKSAIPLSSSSLTEIVSAIKKSKHAISVEIWSETPSLREIEAIGTLPRISRVIFRSGNLVDDVLARTATIESIEELAIYGANIGPNGFSKLAKLKNLRWLIVQIRRPDFGNASFDGLQLEPYLRDADFAILDKLPNLRRLSIVAPITDVAAEQIGKLTSLESLQLGQIRFTRVGYACLKGCASIREFEVQDSHVRAENLEFLPFLKKLAKFSMSTVNVIPDGAPRRIWHIGIATTLSHCKSLEKVCWDAPTEICEDSFSDSDMVSFSSMKQLKLIQFGRTAIYRDQIARLSTHLQSTKIEAANVRQRQAQLVQ